MVVQTLLSSSHNRSGGDFLADIRRIYKLRQGRIIDGVCGGVAAYLDIDPIWVRIGWAALSLAGGIGLIAYGLGMYLFPRIEEGTEQPAPVGRASGPLIGGILLISVAVLLFLRVFGLMQYGFWGAWHVAWIVLWPLSLISGGAFLLFVYWKQGAEDRPRLLRSAGDRMLLGVCSGLAEFLKADINLVRFLFALVILLSRGVGLIAYAAIGLLSPDGESGSEET
ncbi:MAG: PspC domain-containing protein [Candidatus Eisenbacteria bacterium]